MVSQGGFIAYYRVSTSKQGKSGLGISAQRQPVANYLNGGNWRIVGGRLTAKARAAGRAVLQERARSRAADLAPTIKELQAAGCESLRAIALGLDERGIPAARGGTWSAVQVSRLIAAAGAQPRPFEGASVAA